MATERTESTGRTRAFRIGVGGPVGSGKSALVERLVPLLIARGLSPAIVANDVFTKEDERILRRGLAGILDESRIVGVETGTCPHTAVREDPTANLEAIDALTKAYPETDVVLVESGGDNLTLTFSPLLADRSIYVMDVSGGDKMPRKQGPGMIQADYLVINKADLAPYVGASLEVMDRDARALRDGPIQFTNCRGGHGIEAVADWVAAEVNAAAGRRSAVLGQSSAGPVPTMAAAKMVYREDGSPDWGGVWQEYCGLALFGGPPHRGEDAALRAISDGAPAEGYDPIDEIRRGILETTGLTSTPFTEREGWVAVRCESPKMAAWMAASIILENVEARIEGDCLLVPALRSFSLTGEVKSVITVVAKVHHYWRAANLAR